MHSARRNVSNPEVACKGEGGGGGVGGWGGGEGAPPPPLHKACINQKAKVFLHMGQGRLSRERVRWGGVILLSRAHRPVFSTALSSNHSETKSPAEGHLPRCKNGATKRLQGALEIPPLRNSPSAQLPSCSLNTSGVCHILCRCSRGTDLVLMKRESRGGQGSVGSGVGVRCHVKGTLCPQPWFV